VVGLLQSAVHAGAQALTAAPELGALLLLAPLDGQKQDRCCDPEPAIEGFKHVGREVHRQLVDERIEVLLVGADRSLA
jgi:hypothetical protein